jgi:hypothetical protein
MFVVISHQTTTIYERANHRDDFEEIENDLEEEQVGFFLSQSWGYKEMSTISVADPGCLSRILIFTHPDPDFYPPGSRISDPRSKNLNLN